MPLLSRRERLRRSLDLPEGKPFPLERRQGPKPGALTNPAGNIPAQDPSAWAEDFHRWALSCCVWRERAFGGIGRLHTHFSEWAACHESVPCTRQVFEAIIGSQGLFLADGLVYGIILTADAEAIAQRESLTEGSKVVEADPNVQRHAVGQREAAK